jgi:hypothetical protein
VTEALFDIDRCLRAMAEKMGADVGGEPPGHIGERWLRECMVMRKYDQDNSPPMLDALTAAMWGLM